MPPLRRSRDHGAAPLALLLVVGLALVLGLLFFMAAVMFLARVGGLDHAGPLPFVGLGGVFLWLVVAVVVVTLLYRASKEDEEAEDAGSDPAMEELRRAYARGDLSDEEFDRRRERLEGE
jgi:putative membrane protein